MDTKTYSQLTVCVMLAEFLITASVTCWSFIGRTCCFDYGCVIKLKPRLSWLSKCTDRGGIPKRCIQCAHAQSGFIFGTLTENRMDKTLRSKTRTI